LNSIWVRHKESVKIERGEVGKFNNSMRKFVNTRSGGWQIREKFKTLRKDT
jgi:hypothetical protein